MHAFSPASQDAKPRVIGIVAIGFVALAVAMGIGRFAFTPILPMMQADAGLTLRAAGWLAAANYLGYLLGALCAARLSLAMAMRGGLLLIAVTTFAMGLTHVFALELILRLAAGVGSAWVLIHVTVWGLNKLLVADRGEANGVLWSGIGIGIAVAGLLVLGAMQVQWSSDRAWRVFGILSLLVTLALWRTFRIGDRVTETPPDTPRQRIQWNADKWRLMWCYGAFGIGYIIPATYIPAMAHRFITDPLVFGLAWPVFGVAAGLSTWVAATWLARVNDRKLWAVCHVLMAIGVVLPAFLPTLTAVLIAALLVGGTFVVAAMLALREARRATGADATAFVAAMTTAFAVGQILGPLVVSGVAHIPDGFAGALLGAGVVLVLAAISLWRSATVAVEA